MDPRASDVRGAGAFWDDYDAIRTEFGNRSQLQTWETFFSTMHDNFDGQKTLLKNAAQSMDQALSGYLAQVLTGSLYNGMDSLDPWVSASTGLNKKNKQNPFNDAYETLSIDYVFANRLAEEVRNGAPDQGEIADMRGYRKEVKDSFDAIATHLDHLPASASWKGPGGMAAIGTGAGQSLGLKVSHDQLQKFVNAFNVEAQKRLPVDDLDASRNRPLSARASGAAVSKAQSAKKMADMVDANFEQISSAMGRMGNGSIGIDDAGYKALVALLQRSTPSFTPGNLVNALGGSLRAVGLPGVANVVQEYGAPVERGIENAAGTFMNLFKKERPTVGDVINAARDTVEKQFVSPLITDYQLAVAHSVGPQSNGSQSSSG
jgi:hypothetical protein